MKLAVLPQIRSRCGVKSRVGVEEDERSPQGRCHFCNRLVGLGVLQHVSQQQANELGDGALFSVRTNCQRAAFVLGETNRNRGCQPVG